MAENELDPTKLSFSQAQGYEQLPQPLQLEELSREARTRFWDAVYMYIPCDEDTHFLIHKEFFGRPVDEFYLYWLYGEDDPSRIILDSYKALILKSKFNEVFDFLLYVMRHDQCPAELVRDVGAVFQDCHLAYTLDESYPPTIYPAATPQEGEAIIEASKRLRETGLGVAQKHLAEAAEFINSRNWKASIQGSILAVESVAREIADSGDKKSEKALGKALDSLKHKGILQNADLIRAFKQFYAYTSKPGIRHGRSTKEPPNVGRDEAVFMLGACASFASYLCRKQQALPGKDGEW